MAMHKVRVTQVTRVERTIDIEVEAETIEDAVDLQQSSDAPALDDPRWHTSHNTLENETVEAA